MSTFDLLSPEGYPIFLASLAAERTRGKVTPRHQMVRDERELQEFIAKYDKPGRQSYFTVAHLKAPWREKENVAGSCWVWAEIDFQDHPEVTREQMLERIYQIPLKPNLVVFSGHGYHIYWRLPEPADARDGEAQTEFEQVLELACVYVSGDPSVAEAARLMRLPGSHNTRFEGENISVEVVHSDNLSHELDDLRDFFLEARPILPPRIQRERKPSEGNGTAHPFDDTSPRMPIDVDAELATLSHKGRNNGGRDINECYNHASCTLLRCGFTPEEFADRWVSAVMACALREGHGHWTRENEYVRVNDSLKSTMRTMAKETPDDLPWLTSEQLEAWHKAMETGRSPAMVHRAKSGWCVWSWPCRDEGQDAPRTQPQPAVQNAPSNPTWPTPYSGRAPSQIPRRSFLMGTHLQRGKVTMTAGAGGIGKSNLGLIDAISAGIGKDLLTGEVLKQRYRVWVWNAEDDIDEVERRVCGICEYYNINRDDLRGWLFFDDAETCPLEFATAPSGRLAIQEPAIQRVADRVTTLQLDIVMFDPLIGVHTAPENDNASLGKIMRTLGNRIAKPCNCAVEVSHHVRKSNRESDGSVSADDVRGAGAIVTSVRSLRVLVPMSKDEAEKYSIGPDERLRFFRIERGKANYARRGTLHWVELVERPIPNGDNGTYGDTVTICTRWVPPNATAQVTDTVAAAIRDEIGKAEWRRERRAGATWAGNIIGRRLGFDTSQKPQREKAEEILSWLIRTGVLATEYRKDKNRNTREYVIPGLATNPRGD